MFFAKEKNGKLREVVDYRALNRITKSSSTATYRLDEVFDRLGKAAVFSKMELITGPTNSEFTRCCRKNCF